MLVKIYDSIYGFSFVDLKSDKYNNQSLDEITEKFKRPEYNKWIESHKTLYIENCKRVIECQMSGFNLNEINGLKNTNFLLVSFYLNK